MSDSTELVRMEDTPEARANYKLARVRIAELLERYTGDKGEALDLLERWERGVWAGVLFAAPSAAESKEAFNIAATAFLGDG